MGAPSHPQMCGPWWREIPGRPGFTENSPFRLGPQQLTPYGRGVTSRAVFHYQRPLRNPLIDDGLFPRSCLRGHCKRTSQSAGMLGQNSPCPWSPSCHREGPPHLIIAVAELQGRLGKEEGWAMELKETEKLKEGKEKMTRLPLGSTSFIQKVPVSLILCNQNQNLIQYIDSS